MLSKKGQYALDNKKIRKSLKKHDNRQDDSLFYKSGDNMDLINQKAGLYQKVTDDSKSEVYSDSSKIRIRRMKMFDKIAKYIFFFFAMISVSITVGIILTLFTNSIGFFEKVTIVEFLTGKEWTPLFMDPQFGVLPLVLGTSMITAIAAIIAISISRDISLVALRNVFGT